MQLREQLDQLATACRILEMEGHGDMTLGHLSLRDPEGRGFWLKRNARGLGEIMSSDDFVLVDFDGNKLDGEGGRHSEWPIHRSEEHTSELQSRENLVCRLLLEKKNSQRAS